MYKKITQELDIVANDLEAKGLTKEAEMLDIIANTLEKKALNTDTLDKVIADAAQDLDLKEEQYTLFKKVLGAAKKAAELVASQNPNVGPQYKFMLGAIQKLMKDFLITKKNLLGAKSLSSLDLVNKAALIDTAEETKTTLLDAFDTLVKPMDDLVTVLKDNDPADIDKPISEKLRMINDAWIALAPKVLKRVQQVK
jgi:hypothetical protein